MKSELNEKLLTNGKGQEKDVGGEEKLKDKLWIENKKMWVVAGPAIFTRFSNFGIHVIGQAFVGHIGSTELAAYALVVTVFLRFTSGILQGISSHISYLMAFALTFILSVLSLETCSVWVANELGRGSSKAAKFSVVNIVLTSFAIGFVLFVFFLLFRGRLAYIFTENSDVAAAVEDLSNLLAWSILLNSVQPVLSGVAVGAGWQGIVTYVNMPAIT
ncbi:hypothetical protein Vadar_004818 [Vaccinium darrowii]|uniref:Uncharacterized protein n=1 Tax=Vaccinium darrowii TaxID=229202 RepID=A0ACB7YJ85_9ERIC|nr:hypothetical protein Vadar_004818 [Vaccinium darrowii]